MANMTTRRLRTRHQGVPYIAHPHQAVWELHDQAADQPTLLRVATRPALSAAFPTVGSVARGGA